VLRCDQFIDRQSAFDAQELESLLPGVLAWTDDRNLYPLRPLKLGLLGISIGYAPQPTTRGKDFADWQRLWQSSDADVLRGEVRYAGGHLLTKAESSLERLTAADFRLRSDSPGYRAGKDGKDLGADIDLVGPGPAYERWKQTPGYEQWLKDTRQIKSTE
jgi:hypothetical protein